MSCSEPGHRALFAIVASRARRVAELGSPQMNTTVMKILASSVSMWVAVGCGHPGLAVAVPCANPKNQRVTIQLELFVHSSHSSPAFAFCQCPTNGVFGAFFV
jgi:hypothetical protein